MIIGEAFSQWVQSYRDLPLLINQWANVMRWEMRTRLFLRTAEILWQEGHTAHACEQEARDETRLMLDVYKNLCEKVLAVPVIASIKPVFERFPGAVETWTIEALMQDGKALQAGTSHFLGQTFSKACNIRFTNAQEEIEYAWTTSWGVTTRLIGAVVMTHSDDNGLVLPPRIAPSQVIIIPILKKGSEEMVLKYCHELQSLLKTSRAFDEPVRVRLDNKDLSAGSKSWYWIKKGAPIRLEVGPKECADNSVLMSQRLPDGDVSHKVRVSLDDIQATIPERLSAMQELLLERALTFRESSISEAHSISELDALLALKENPGLIIAPLLNHDSVVPFLKERGLTARCMVPQETRTGCCIATGTPDCALFYLAKAY
jgi:prolyl-tRNA synthetase